MEEVCVLEKTAMGVTPANSRKSRIRWAGREMEPPLRGHRSHHLRTAFPRVDDIDAAIGPHRVGGDRRRRFQRPRALDPPADRRLRMLLAIPHGAYSHYATGLDRARAISGTWTLCLYCR